MNRCLGGPLFDEERSAPSFLERTDRERFLRVGMSVGEREREGAREAGQPVYGGGGGVE